MSRFSGIGAVTTRKGGLWFLDGDYLVEIQEVKFFKSTSGFDTFVAEAKVLESTNPARGAGCTSSQVVTFKNLKFRDMYLRDVKQFAAAALGVDPDSYVEPADSKVPGDTAEAATERFWQESLEYIFSEEKPLTGQKLRLNVVTKKNPETGKAFSPHTWSAA